MRVITNIEHIEDMILEEAMDQLNVKKHLDLLEKEKVCIIQDVSKLGKMLSYPIMDRITFDRLYDSDIEVLNQFRSSLQQKISYQAYQKL